MLTDHSAAVLFLVSGLLPTSARLHAVVVHIAATLQHVELTSCLPTASLQDHRSLLRLQAGSQICIQPI